MKHSHYKFFCPHIASAMQLQLAIVFLILVVLISRLIAQPPELSPKTDFSAKSEASSSETNSGLEVISECFPHALVSIVPFIFLLSFPTLRGLVVFRFPNKARKTLLPREIQFRGRRELHGFAFG